MASPLTHSSLQAPPRPFETSWQNETTTTSPDAENSVPVPGATLATPAQEWCDQGAQLCSDALSEFMEAGQKEKQVRISPNGRMNACKVKQPTLRPSLILGCFGPCTIPVLPLTPFHCLHLCAHRPDVGTAGD